MGEALIAALSWGFRALDVNRIDAQVHTRNHRSLTLLGKLGFLEEGRLRQFGYWNGEYHDMLQYSLLRAEWTGEIVPQRK